MHIHIHTTKMSVMEAVGLTVHRNEAIRFYLFHPMEYNTYRYSIISMFAFK